MKKISLFLLIFLLLFVGLLIWNAVNYKPNQTEVEQVQKVTVPVGAADRMAEAISIRTVSFEDEADFDSTQFELFNAFLEKSYPLVFANMKNLNKVMLVFEQRHLLRSSKQVSKKM